MTYTEQDLRAVLGALESDAPDVAGTLAGVDRLRHRRTVRRRVVGMAAVAAVTMALAAGALAVPSLVRSNEQPATTEAADAWRFRFAVDLPGLQVRSQQLEGGRQQMSVLSAAGQMIFLDVFDRGNYDPAKVRPGRPVDVNGKPGFYRDDIEWFVRPGYEKGSHPVTPGSAGVAWEYAPDSWAVVYGVEQAPADIEAELLRLARAVRFDQTTLFRVPFKIDHLPADLRPTRLLYTVVHPSGKPDVDLSFVTVELSAGDGRSLTIEASTRNPDLPLGDPVVDRGQVAINLGPFMISLWTSESPGQAVPEAERVKIARSISLAGEWGDRSTWIEAQRAIPTM